MTSEHHWKRFSPTRQSSVSFSSGPKKAPGKQLLWCKEKAGIPIKELCDWETWVWVFYLWGLGPHAQCEHLSCLFQRRKKTQSFININLQQEHWDQEIASRASHFNFISSYIPRQKTEFTYDHFSMSIPNTSWSLKSVLGRLITDMWALCHY